MRAFFLSSTFKRLSRHHIYSRHLRTATYAMASSAETPVTPVVPDGYTLHSENSSHILLPKDNGAFLNPVQEFNRDLSVACIRVWGEQTNELKRQKWEQRVERAESKAKKQKSEFSGCLF